MKTAYLVGTNSKIGQKILKFLPPDIQILDQVPEQLDYLFLASSNDKSLAALNQYGARTRKIIDFSGATKLSALAGQKGMTYALNYDPKAKLVALPGCSSWGILSALLPLHSLSKNLLPEVIFADVKFAKSALQFDSPSLQLQEDIKLIYPLQHFHQQEINLALGQPNLVQMAPSIIDLPQGVSINLMFKPLQGVDYISALKNSLHPNYVQIVDQIPTLQEVIGTKNIIMQVSQNNWAVNINICLDNLVNDRFLSFL
jgi:N-acetyl-gamma-glutamylphosphate reductase